VLTLVYFFATGWGLGIQHIVSPDEPRYAVRARNMLHGGDPIVPFFNGHPHLEKPALFYWLLVVSGTVAQFIGVSLDTAGFRLAPLFMGWLAVLGIYLLGRRLLNPRGACVAAVILMTSYQFHDVARELVIDMTLTAFLLWSWLFFHIALGRLERGARSFWPLLGFYLCLGLACMSKGPFLVGIFSTVPLVAYLFWTRRQKLLARAGLWWGLPLALALGLSWFVALKSKGYDPTPFFSVENLARFFGRKDHVHRVPFLFYLYSLFQIFAPWVVLVPFAAWWSYKTWHDVRHSARLSNGLPLPTGEITPHNRGGITAPPCPLPAGEMKISDGAKLLACALGISFVIMGLSQSKRHLYLLPLFPYLALWLAWFLERTFLSREGEPGNKASVYLLDMRVMLAPACFACTLWLPQAGGLPVETAGCVVLCIVMWIALAMTARALKQGKRQRTVCLLLTAAVLLAFGREAVIRPIHERALNLGEFYAEVKDKLADRRLVIAGMNSNEASWYLDKTLSPIDQVSVPELENSFYGTPGTALLVREDALANPALKGCVIPLSGKITRNKETFVLVVPDPAHPPDPAAFKVRAAKRKAGFFDDL